MPDDDTTPAAPAATPVNTPAPAATHTPAPTEPPAGEGNETFSLEEARKLRRENQTLRQRQKAIDEAEQAAKEAQLSEVERVKKQHADMVAKYDASQHEIQELKIQRAVERHATELKFYYPEIAVNLLERAALEFDENGAPKNVKHLLEKLLKAMPKLAPDETPEPPAPGQQAPQQRQAPVTPPMGMNGRNTIPAPGQQPTGKPTRLEDLTWSR